jgi:hypothetical protein
LSSNVRQIRPTVDFDKPLRLAIEERVQCIAFSGVDSNVAASTSSTCSVVIVAGLPGRGSSTSPSNRSSQNRDRHFPIVDAVTPTVLATSAFDTPVAHCKTIRERNANAWEDLRRRSHRTSCSRSDLSTPEQLLDVQFLACPMVPFLWYELQAQDTRRLV